MHPKAIELIKKYEELEKKLSELPPGSSDYIKIAKERSELEELVAKYREFGKLEKEEKDLFELINSEEDEELKKIAKEDIEKIKIRKEELENEILLLLLPKDEMASKNVIVEIRAGTGGEEAAIFAGDLFRMYTRYAERKKWKYEILDFNPTELGGYKEVVFSIKGKDVYAHLKYESGVHRVQRIPVTEAGGRIHTSTASVVVLPEVDEVDVQIDPKDLKIDTFRAGGAGGQYVNKTESAVRITHIPTGIVVACQEERSQLQNRATALRILRSKLFDMEMQKKIEEQSQIRKTSIRSGDRSDKIRTYNFPQNRLTDHRINLTLYKLDAILDGDCDELINACIMNEQQELLKNLG
ncbi:MAG: peptide chain release factor 1 [Brevinematales bacterium]|nr:peptide chain release factor 1 [Brevinematales bacterium]